MTELRQLSGGSATTVNFEDHTKYRIVRATEDVQPTYDVVENPIRNSNPVTTNLGLSRKIALDFTFETLVTGGGWSAVIANLDAIETQLTAAENFAMYQTGAQVYWEEQHGDMSAPRRYKVVRGEVSEVRSKRLIPRNYTFARVRIHCMPGTV